MGGLKEKENDLNVKKKNKIQKKLHQFENILNMIEQNEEHYFDEQFIPCFEVESEDNALKNRIESILYCVDTALYPISCDFDCVNDFDSVFEDRANNNTKAIELALNQIGIGDVEKEQKEKVNEAPIENANNESEDVQMETIQNNETEEVQEEITKNTEDGDDDDGDVGMDAQNEVDESLKNVNDEMEQTEDTNKDQIDNEIENESVGSEQSEKRGQKRKLEVDSKNDEENNDGDEEAEDEEEENVDLDIDSMTVYEL